MNGNDIKVSLSRIYYPVKVLGPGNRVGIWLNGCNRNCIGCISPEMQRYDKTKEIAVSEIIRMIQSINAPVDGFTISGGEPFYNPFALDVLVRGLVSVCDDIIIFTGYTIEELRDGNDASVISVLDNCSVLIDGPYVEELNDNTGLRGSANQRFWYFKNRNKYAGIETKERKQQNIVYRNNVLTIGIP